VKRGGRSTSRASIFQPSNRPRPGYAVGSGRLCPSARHGHKSRRIALPELRVGGVGLVTDRAEGSLLTWPPRRHHADAWRHGCMDIGSRCGLRRCRFLMSAPTRFWSTWQRLACAASTFGLSMVTFTKVFRCRFPSHTITLHTSTSTANGVRWSRPALEARTTRIKE
jgi:hypothetical protein